MGSGCSRPSEASLSRPEEKGNPTPQQATPPSGPQEKYVVATNPEPSSHAPDPTAASSMATAHELPKMDVPQKYSRRRRRQAVSAEADGNDEDFEPKVVPKSNETKAQIRAVAMKCFLFTSLDSDQLDVVIDSMEEKKVEPGDVVIQQGDDGDFFYIIDHGKFDVLKTIDNEEKKVFFYDNKGSFGELALMYNAPRAATVKATSSGVLWAVERSTFRHLVVNANAKRKRQYEEFIHNVPLFEKLTHQERSLIADCLEPRDYKDGDVIIKQGEVGDKFYIIEKGAAVATQKHGDRDVVVGQMGVGQYFGERALITNEPRAANVLAKGDTRVAAMARDAFERLLGDCKKIMHRQISEYKSAEEVVASQGTSLPKMDVDVKYRRRGRRAAVSAEVNNDDDDFVPKVIPKSDDAKARIREAVQKSFLFSSLDSDKLDLVVDSMEEKKVNAGDVVIRQGDSGDYFYIIDSGKFDVLKTIAQEEKKVFFYDNSGSFGELALMYGAPRAATVKATSDAVLWAVDRATFRHVVIAATAKQRRLYESFIHKVPLFANLTPQERSLIADCLVPRTYTDNEIIIKQGDPGAEFFLIEKGSAVATQTSPDGQEVVVGKMETGQYFGERALLTNEPRAANVKAVGTTKVAAMARDAFERLLGDCKEIMARQIEQYPTAQEVLAGQRDPHALPKMEVTGPHTGRYRRRGRRQAVSAEVDNSGDADFKPPVVPKSDAAKERIRAATENSFLFSSLDSDKKKTVVDAMEEKKVTKGDVLIKQGDDGDYFYIIDHGKFDVLKTIDSEEKKVFFYDNKGSFGELALMYNAPRAATVKATSDGVCWALDRGTFRHVVIAASSRQRKLYEKFIKEVPLFANLTDSERSRIADCLEPREYADSEVIIKQGDPGDKLYFIEKGSAVATQTSPDGQEVVVGKMEAGQYFGERALLTNEPRAANVKAVGTTKVAAMARDAFERLLGDCKEIMARQIEQYPTAQEVLAGQRDPHALPKMEVTGPHTGRYRRRGRRQAVSAEVDNSDDADFKPRVIPKSDAAKERIRSAVSKSFLFSSLDSDKLNLVIDAMDERKVTNGDVLIKQGDDGDFFYIIDHGKFDVLKTIDNEEKKVFFYDNKGSFGELALMYNAPRAATVKATSDGICWAVDRATFRHVVISATAQQRKLYEKFIHQVPLFANLTAQERSLIADCLEPADFKDGEVIIKQGDIGDKFYLIEKGAAVATQKHGDRDVVVGQMGVGQYFGERALITNEPRAANVLAKGDTRVAAMARDAFERLLGDCKDIMHRQISEYESAAQVLAKQKK